ncbi:MAG: lipase family protein [Acidaminococcaceae bacterium]|nr:lipase family protein [Acidaminococcaceae bacterium]
MHKLNHLLLTCCILGSLATPVLAATPVLPPAAVTAPVAVATANTQTVKKPPQLTRSQFAAAYEDARLISLAAGACAGTYKNKATALEYEYLGEYGWEITPQTVKKDGVTANFMIATHPALPDGTDLGIIAFRGSSSLGDWKQNFKFDQVNYGGKTPAEFAKIASSPAKKGDYPKVHRGFDQYVRTGFDLKLDLNLDGKEDNLLDLLKENPKMRVLITGHSLGGAAATLFAERLVSMGVPKDQLPVVTFGAPAVGNEAFAREYGNKINLLRVRNTHDIVPKILYATGSNYTQFGKEIVFPLSNKYSDMSHPISLYYDYAVKNYYDTVDEGIALGYLPHTPLEKLTGTAPLVAVVARPLGSEADPRYTPNILRFVIHEYKSLLPRYTFLTSTEDQLQQANLQQLLTLAAKKKARYLIVLEAGLKQAGQTAKYYTTLNQAVFNVPGGTLLTMNASGSHVTYDKGVVQTAMYDMLSCQKDLEAKLPFLNKERIQNW